MERVIEAELTNMCMIYDGNGNVLVQDRVKKTWPGITFPGGHVEKNESIVDSVMREVKEETGLDISNLEICGIKDWSYDDGSRYIAFLYKTCAFSGSIKSSSEGKVFWTEISNLKSMNLSEGMEKTIDVFINDDINEYYFYRENGKWLDILK